MRLIRLTPETMRDDGDDEMWKMKRWKDENMKKYWREKPEGLSES